MEYRDYTNELAELCESCRNDIIGMLRECNAESIRFNNDEDEALVLTVYDGDGEWNERTIEYCKFIPKEKIGYDRILLTDTDGRQYSAWDLTENDLMVLYDAIYNRIYDND